MKDKELARLVMEKVDQVFKPVSNVKEKDVLLKCIKWGLECISKYKRLVMFVEDKVKLFKKARNVKLVWVKKYRRKKR